MPQIVRWYLKTALIYFLAGLTVGILLVAGNITGGVLPGLMRVYLHLLVVGWITQLIFGIATWMFPKYSQAMPRGNETINWTVYILLNFGLILRTAGEPLNSAYPGAVWGWMLVVSAVAQWLAGTLFVVNAWPRVKGK